MAKSVAVFGINPAKTKDWIVPHSILTAGQSDERLVLTLHDPVRDLPRQIWICIRVVSMDCAIVMTRALAV
jgi:hypothetical protein